MLLLITIKPPKNGLVAHYTEIANNVSLPIIIYNVPGRTGVNILPETCLELSNLSNIVAIKEASGNISQVAKISSLCGNRLQIYSGNDDQILPILSLGGIGVISVFANILPNEVHNLIQQFQEGNIKEALYIQNKYLPLINQLFCEVNPIPVKQALNILGYNVGIPRLPLIKLSNQNEEDLTIMLQNYKIL